MGLDHLWAGWRRAYIETVTASPPAARAPVTPPAARAPMTPPASLFEGILALDDGEGFIVHRGKRCSVLLNAYPYTNGHVLVMPNRALPTLGGLDDDEHAELWELVRDAVAAIERAYASDGINVGVNQGRAAGAGVPEHVHVHVLPRWNGDTNFMTAVAETRVTPETLSATWHKLRKAWPGS